jgi:membrane protease YdiL (CAAX protease family)
MKERKITNKKNILLVIMKYKAYIPILLMALVVLAMGAWNPRAMQEKKNDNPNGCPNYLWIALIALAVGLASVYLYVKHKENYMKYIPVVITAVAIALVHYGGPKVIPEKEGCPNSLWISLGVLVVGLISVYGIGMMAPRRVHHRHSA